MISAWQQREESTSGLGIGVFDSCSNSGAYKNEINLSPVMRVVAGTGQKSGKPNNFH
jgi:hypothetical protein